ncbi:MAG: M28 family peptidase [Candidatus Helarchaeota archaeon]|nr:M28 family peptidase [Candidatus Helarchaeota archaeon]
MDDYREDLAYQQTKQLAKWHRFIGSEGEDKARRHIYGQFTGLGIECKREPFTCSDFLAKYVLRIGMPILGVVLVIIAYLYMQNLFIQSLIIACALLACVPLINILTSGTDFGSSLGTKYQSENLIGYIKARNPVPKRMVYLISHYDTKSQTFPVLIRIVLYVVGLFGGLAILLLTLISTIVYLIKLTIFIPGNILFYCSIIFCVILALLFFNRTGNESVGAADNAAAVGVQIAIIRDLLDFPPENTDVYFLSTSAEELGLFGALAFIKQHENELDKNNTYFLNYDIIGGKGMALLHTKYGLPPKSTSKEINNILLQIAEEKNLKVGTQWLPTGAMADHFPILKRGFKTTWIQTGDRKVSAKIHTPKDNMDLITKESLRTAIILGFEFIQRIDKKP